MVAIAIFGLPPIPPSDPSWDGFNGLGIGALVLLLLCCWIGPAASAGYSIHALRLHIGASLILLIGVAAHALGMLLSNDVMVEYLKWRAPLYMHAGNLGFVLMLIMAVVSIRPLRRRLHKNFNAFRHYHRWLSVVIIVLTGWHIAGSGFLVGAAQGASSAWTEHGSVPGLAYWRGWLLALALLLTTWTWWQQPGRWRQPSATTGTKAHIVSALLLIMLLTITVAYLLALNLPLLIHSAGAR